MRLSLFLLLLLVWACPQKETLNCLETPDEEACVESCRTDPSQAHCAMDDAGTDGGPADAGDSGGDGDAGECNCGGDTPVCDEDGDGACVQCLDVDDCPDDNVCVDRECVQCGDDDDCNDSGTAPRCDTETGTCVPCLEDIDCTADAPLCADDHTCQGCEDSADCLPYANTPHCEINEGRCVACIAHTHCTTPAAARCTDDFVCGPCTDSTQCAGTDAGVCDEGSCVECNAGDETACVDFVCDVLAQTCTTNEAASKGLCQECISDRECMDGQLCIPMEFDDTELGYFCLWREAANVGGSPNGSCLNTPPYADPLEETNSIGGTQTTVCGLAVSTCAAHDHFRGTSCDTAFENEMCGAPMLEDGLCREFDSSNNRCTVRCLSSDDCPDGTTCNTGATPRYCNF